MLYLYVTQILCILAFPDVLFCKVPGWWKTNDKGTDLIFIAWTFHMLQVNDRNNSLTRLPNHIIRTLLWITQILCKFTSISETSFQVAWHKDSTKVCTAGVGMRIFPVDKSIFHLRIDDDLMCKIAPKTKWKKERETNKTKIQVPFCCFMSLVHYGTEQKPDLGLALLKLPLHTIIKVKTTWAIKQRVLLLLVPADVIQPNKQFTNHCFRLLPIGKIECLQ